MKTMSRNEFEALPEHVGWLEAEAGIVYRMKMIEDGVGMSFTKYSSDDDLHFSIEKVLVYG